MKYKVLGREFQSLEKAIHFLEVSIRLESDQTKIFKMRILLRKLKKGAPPYGV
jgi:hypothetical protein